MHTGEDYNTTNDVRIDNKLLYYNLWLSLLLYNIVFVLDDDVIYVDLRRISIVTPSQDITVCRCFLLSL